MGGQVTKIHAWIRNPKNNLFKGMSKRSALFELFCENPDSCDLLQKDNSCVHCGPLVKCPFGSKRETEGPTPRAQSFYSTLKRWREQNEEYLGRLSSFTAFNRIFKTNGHYYLPYSHMSESFMSIGSGYPLKKAWLPEEELTPELLERICTARPRPAFGDELVHYQKEEVPKFISDLNAHYPAVFAMLSDAQKARLQDVSYVGRKADITTCAPGDYVFSKDPWHWDGEVLRGKSMLFQPVPGELAITIRPKPGSKVEITDNSQVTSKTRFLD